MKTMKRKLSKLGTNGHGDAFHEFNVCFFVTRKVLARALGNHAALNKGMDIKSLTKSKALEILEHELYFYGSEGRYNNILDWSNDFTDVMDEYLPHIFQWIDKNYPQLTTQSP